MREPEPPGRERVRLRREAAAVALLTGFGYLLLRSSPALAPGAFADDGIYLALGKALAGGDGYRSIYAVGAPLHVKYPPGLPLLYAGLWRLGQSLPAVHRLAGLLSLTAASGAAGLLWWIGRARLRLGSVTLLILALCPLFLEGNIQYLNLPLSEPVFLFLVTAAWALFPKIWGGHRRAALAVGLLIGAATCVRAQGIVLLPAVVLALLVRRPPAGVVAPLFAPMVTLIGSASVLLNRPAGMAVEPDEQAYAAALAIQSGWQIPERLVQAAASNAATYAGTLPLHLTAHRGLGLALILGLVLLAAIGVVRRSRLHPDLTAGVTALAGALVLWPYAQDRFVLMLLPLIGLLAAAGLADWLRDKRPFAPPVAVMLLWSVTVLVAQRQATIRQQARDPAAAAHPYFHPAWFLRENTRYLAAASAWLAEESRASDRVLAPLPSGLYLLSGRAGVNATPFEASGKPLFTTPGHYLAERLRDQRPTLLLLWGSSYPISRDAALLQAACPEVLRYQGQTADSSAGAAVFRIVEDACLVEWARSLDVEGAWESGGGR